MVCASNADPGNPRLVGSGRIASNDFRRGLKTARFTSRC